VSGFVANCSDLGQARPGDEARANSRRHEMTGASVGAVERNPWVRGPFWDTTWMLCAVWLVPLVLYLSRGLDDPRQGPLDTLYFGLTAVFWISHRVGSTWLAYLTTAYRPLLRAQPVRFLVVPVAIAAACCAVLLPADEALPWSRAERVIALAILDYGLVTYHFGAQHFGALSLYRVRAGGTTRSWQRSLDLVYAMTICGALVFGAEILAGTVAFHGAWLDRWIDPDRVADSAGSLRTMALAAVAVATLAMLAVEARSSARSLPRALYLVGAAAMVAVALLAQSPFVFVAVWTVQHWIVATGLSTVVASGEPPPERSRWRAALHAVHCRPWVFVCVLATVSMLLLPIMEVEAVDDDASFYAERIFGSLATNLRTSAWVPALLALGFTTGFLHYWLDRAVFRMSDPRVRAAAHRLFAKPSARG